MILRSLLIVATVEACRMATAYCCCEDEEYWQIEDEIPLDEESWQIEDEIPLDEEY